MERICEYHHDEYDSDDRTDDMDITEVSCFYIHPEESRDKREWEHEC